MIEKIHLSVRAGDPDDLRNSFSQGAEIGFAGPYGSADRLVGQQETIEKCGGDDQEQYENGRTGNHNYAKG